MEMVLAGLAREKCIVYLDDILVTGKSFREHFENLFEVFKCLRQFTLRLKPCKWHLAKCRVTYLGYRVSVSGISADSSKVKTVKKFQPATDVRSLHSFLGLTNYSGTAFCSYPKECVLQLE